MPVAYAILAGQGAYTMQATSTYKKAVHLWKSSDSLRMNLDSFRVLFAYHSGKIENDAITYKDTYDIFHTDRVSSFTGNPRTLFEQHNQKICSEFLNSKMLEKKPITIELIKEIHAILTAGVYSERLFLEKGERPGEFKKQYYVTGLLEVGSAPEEVALDMATLLSEIDVATMDTSLSSEALLKAAAYFHVRFENIHPFADGSGRVGRTLLNYLLMTNGHPPLIIHEENREQYFESLQAYDRHEDTDPMFEFLRLSVEKTWHESIGKA